MKPETRKAVTRADVEAKQRRALELGGRCARMGVAIPPIPPFLLDCKIAAVCRLLIERGILTDDEISAATADVQAEALAALLTRHTGPGLFVPAGAAKKV